MTLAVDAIDPQLAADLHQVVARPQGFQVLGHLVHPEALGDGGEIHVEIRDVLLQGVGVDRGYHMQIAEARLLPGLGNKLVGWHLGRFGIRPKAPQIDQGAHGDVQRPAALAANVNGLGHHPGCVTGDHQRGIALVLVEARQLGIRAVGGHLIVDPFQQDIHLGLQLGGIRDGGIRHLDGVVGAHGAAGDVDLRLGLDRFLTAPRQEKG
ncbi:hypothetical protein D3C84_244590 [compost metagenome]